MSILKGVGVALVTPFNEDLSVDFDSLTKLVEYNIENGTNYLVVLGTTAEAATLSDEEKKQVIEHIIKVNNKRLPLVLGIGGNNTLEVKKQIEEADLSAFEAVLSVSPYYNKPNQEGLYQHYKALASTGKILSFIMYLQEQDRILRQKQRSVLQKNSRTYSDQRSGTKYSSVF
jgi:4-hydroxy-tetrahydrodipicolinate synthase